MPLLYCGIIIKTCYNKQKKKNNTVYEEKLTDVDLHDQQETFFNFDKQLFPELADIRTIK